jgi:hypothetical protein
LTFLAGWETGVETSMNERCGHAVIDLPSLPHSIHTTVPIIGMVFFYFYLKWARTLCIEISYGFL